MGLLNDNSMSYINYYINNRNTRNNTPSDLALKKKLSGFRINKNTNMEYDILFCPFIFNELN